MSATSTVRLELREIAHLESLGYLNGAQRADRKAVAEAVEAFICDSVSQGAARHWRIQFCTA